MKKICAITTVEATMESFVIPAMRVFKDNGYDVTLICSMSDAFKERYGKEFCCIDVKMKRGISLGDVIRKPFEFCKIFRRERFDYVQYATTNASFYACFPAMLCGIKTRVYCQWGLLYIGYSGLKRKIFFLVEKILCMTATHVTIASKKNLEYAVSQGLLKADKASVIGDGGTVGVDLNVYDIAKRPVYRAEVISEYPVLEGKIVFGFVGRIEVDKGVNELLEAFLGLDNPNYALLMIGRFDSMRNNLNPELLQRVTNSARVIFHGFTRDVPKYMSAIDVLVHPTYREGFSMVIQQAMAMGCAIVTTDVPGPSEVIEEGVSGMLVPAGNSQALMAALKTVGESETLRNRYAEAGLKRVKGLFNRERMLGLTYENRLRMMAENNS